MPDLLKAEEAGLCYAISAKRYAIYEETATGDIRILKRSEHGLGHLLDPKSPDEDRLDDNGDRLWVDEVWRWIITAHSEPDTPPPEWASLPAMARITVSSVSVYRPFWRLNESRAWADKIKPFNFLLAATVDPFGCPPGINPEDLRLVAPFSTDPQQWLQQEWFNLYDPDGHTYRITTDPTAPPQPGLAVVKSYRNVLLDYRLHPEHKFNGPDGEPCGRTTKGLLERRPVNAAGPVHHIGKETNRLDDVQAGIVGHLDEVVTEYGSTDQWRNLVLPVLGRYSGRQLGELMKTDRRTIDRIRAGQRPHKALARSLMLLAGAVAADDVGDHHLRFPSGSVEGSLDMAAAQLVLAAWTGIQEARMP